MLIPNFVLRLIGSNIAKKLNLQENNEMPTKPWYQSKTIWASVTAALVGIYNAIAAVHPLPVLPDWIFTVLGAIGVYSRVTADTKIS